MRYIKVFEDFKKNNQQGTLITIDDVIKCIKSGGVLYATIIKDFAENDPKLPLKPVNVDDDGEVTVEFEGREYEVNLRNIESIDF
jgi:hypothetical protein